jgi:hypothetical protein
VCIRASLIPHCTFVDSAPRKGEVPRDLAPIFRAFGPQFGDRKRQLPVQGQLRSTQIQKGKITRLTHRPYRHRGTYYPPGSTLSGNQQDGIHAHEQR